MITHTWRNIPIYGISDNNKAMRQIIERAIIAKNPISPPYTKYPNVGNPTKNNRYNAK